MDFKCLDLGRWPRLLHFAPLALKYRDCYWCCRSTLSHERHWVRRRAFNVPHEAQRKYIVRANQEVMIALKLRIAISTTAFRRNSLNLCVSPGEISGPLKFDSH